MEEFIGNADQNRFLASFFKAIQTGKKSFSVPKCNTLCFGKYDFPLFKLVDWSISGSMKDSGRVIVSGRILDDVETKSTEGELIEFFENSPIAMHWLNDKGLIVWANKAELAMLGYTAAEYLGHNMAEFCPDDAELLQTILSHLHFGGSVTNETIRFRTKDGQTKCKSNYYIALHCVVLNCGCLLYIRISANVDLLFDANSNYDTTPEEEADDSGGGETEPNATSAAEENASGISDGRGREFSDQISGSNPDGVSDITYTDIYSTHHAHHGQRKILHIRCFLREDTDQLIMDAVLSYERHRAVEVHAQRLEFISAVSRAVKESAVRTDIMFADTLPGAAEVHAPRQELLQSVYLADMVQYGLHGFLCEPSYAEKTLLKVTIEGLAAEASAVWSRVGQGDVPCRVRCGTSAKAQAADEAQPPSLMEQGPVPDTVYAHPGLKRALRYLLAVATAFSPDGAGLDVDITYTELLPMISKNLEASLDMMRAGGGQGFMGVSQQGALADPSQSTGMYTFCVTHTCAVLLSVDGVHEVLSNHSCERPLFVSADDEAGATLDSFDLIGACSAPDEMLKRLTMSSLKLGLFVASSLVTAMEGLLKFTVTGTTARYWFSVPLSQMPYQGMADYSSDRIELPDVVAEFVADMKHKGGLDVAPTPTMLSPLRGSIPWSAGAATISNTGSRASGGDTVRSDAVSVSIPAATPARLKPVRILVVDDSPLCQKVLTRALSEMGFQTAVADNGRAALDRLVHVSQPFDAVIMDVIMPIMDGYTATKICCHELHLTVPIFVLSADVLPDTRQSMLGLGASAFITKPVKLFQMISLLHQFGVNTPGSTAYLEAAHRK